MGNGLRFYVFLGPVCVMHNAGRIKVTAWLSAKKMAVLSIKETKPGVFKMLVAPNRKNKPGPVEIKRG